MNTSQLTCALNCDIYLKFVDKYVLAADQLPKISIRQFPCVFIVNTDSSTEPGKHWVAFYFDEYKNGEFFDSYGNTPQSYNRRFLNFLRQNALSYRYNDKKLQNDYSDVCGQYCVYFLMFRARKYSMQRIVGNLSFEYNDQYVYDMIKDVFYMCFSSQITCTDNQSCKPLITRI